MLGKIISAIFMCSSAIYVWGKLYGCKTDFKDYKLYLGFFTLGFVATLSYSFSIMYMRILITVIILTLANWYIFKKDLKITIVSTLTYEIIAIVSETIFSVIIMILLSEVDFEIVQSTYFGATITNIVIAIIIFIIIQFEWFKKLYASILKYTKKISIAQFMMILAIFIVSYNLLFFIIYSRTNFLLSIIICTMTTMIYAFIAYKIVCVQNDYLTVFGKYSNTLDNLKEYEKMIDLYHVSNHENKNQLLTIRNMLNKKDKDISNYIDKIIDNKTKDDEKIIFETSVIPDGGLRAVIYSKLLDMKSRKIKYSLNVDKKIKAIELLDLGEDLVLDICKIVGVYLDNAIDATYKLRKPLIDIDLHIMGEENTMCIFISNNFEGIVELDKIDNEKYTTKGEGHGYGLSLVKKVVAKNDRLSNNTSIIDDVFKQELKIKM